MGNFTNLLLDIYIGDMVIYICGKQAYLPNLKENKYLLGNIIAYASF